VGAGDVVARFWNKTLCARASVEVVGVCSAGGRSAAATAAIHGAKVAAGYGDLIDDPDVDSLLIASPPHTHLEIAGAALAAGKNVLLEKPICANLADARSLLAMGRDAPGILGITFNNRLRDNNAWVRDQVLKGVVGRPLDVQLRWHRTKGMPPEPWRADPGRAFGGVLADLGSHLLSMGLAVLPDRRHFDAHCRLHVAAGAQARLDHAATASARIDDRVTLHLSAAWDVDMAIPVNFAFEVSGTSGDIAASGYPGKSDDGYGTVLDGFLSAVENARQPDLDLFEDVMILLDAFYRAAADGSVAGRFAAGERGI